MNEQAPQWFHYLCMISMEGELPTCQRSYSLVDALKALKLAVETPPYIRAWIESIRVRPEGGTK